MATGPVSAVKVGSYFVGQYYHVLQRQPELVHQFYNDVSSMVRVDGDSTLTADTILKIHTVIMSLNFITTEIKTINSLHSWGGGVLVMVSGSVRTSDHNEKRFMQSFFLAPQEKGFFVLNDVFHFIEDKLGIEDYAPQLFENKSDSLLGVSNSLPEAQVSDYGLEEEVVDYVQSLNVEDVPLDNYGFESEPHLPYSEQHSEMHEYADQLSAIEKTATEYFSNERSLHSAAIDEVHEEEPQKKTYASILRVAKGQPAPSKASQTSNNLNGPLASEWDSKPQPAVQQLQAEALNVPETKETATENYSGQNDDGELLKSVYVRNLPASVTATQLEQEFKRFGKIIHDGIFIRNRPDIGVCYAFVEYESMDAVHAAIQGSPLELDGTQIHVEERRANAMSSYRGGRRGGRGRGGYSSDAPRGGRFGGRGSGRGSYQEAGGYNRQKSNGYHQ